MSGLVAGSEPEVPAERAAEAARPTERPEMRLPEDARTVFLGRPFLSSIQERAAAGGCIS